MPRLTAARALTAHIANRFIRIATFVATGVVIGALLLSAVLAYYFSGWWWLLALPFLVLFMIFLLVRFGVKFIVGRIHGEQLRADQRQALDDLTSKIERLVEARGTPPILFVVISIKDLVMHRDITTIKQLISDTTSLQRDYQQLERLF